MPHTPTTNRSARRATVRGIPTEANAVAAHVIRVDITELTVRHPDEPEEPRVIPPADVEAIEARVRELSEAEKIWESKGDHLRALRLELGQRLFALLDGPGRRLARGLAEARAVDTPPHLIIRMRTDTAGSDSGSRALRWRWVTLCAPNSGPLFADPAIASPRLTLQLGTAEFSEATAPPTRCLRVLFMASSPLATEPVLDFENEEEQLLAAVVPFVDDGRVRFDVIEDGTLEALRERLQKDAYDVVVLSSHGLRTDAGPRLAHLVQGAVLPEAVAYARRPLVADKRRDPSAHAWATVQLVSRSALGFRLDATWTSGESHDNIRISEPISAYRDVEEGLHRPPETMSPS